MSVYKMEKERKNNVERLEEYIKNLDKKMISILNKRLIEKMK